jgi:hypothetical protein
MLVTVPIGTETGIPLIHQLSTKNSLGCCWNHFTTMPWNLPLPTWIYDSLVLSWGSWIHGHHKVRGPGCMGMVHHLPVHGVRHVLESAGHLSSNTAISLMSMPGWFLLMVTHRSPIFNELYSFAQNNPHMGFTWTSPIINYEKCS